jgi:predicted nucleotidyltransferase
MLSLILSQKSNLKVLKLFSFAPGKALNRNQIKGYTKLANVPLDNALNRLQKEGIIEKQKNVIRLNLSNKKTEEILTLFKEESRYLREIPYKIWLILFDYSNSIKKTRFVKMFLFGSWAKHIARENSDLDLALIINKRDVKQELKAEKIAENLEKKYGLKIQIHFFEEKEFFEKKNSVVKEINLDGIEIF